MNALSKLRLLGWTLIALLLTALVLALAPQQLPVTLYKINLVALAGVLGYWLDRALFPYARPDEWVDKIDTLSAIDVGDGVSEEGLGGTPGLAHELRIFPDFPSTMASACMIRRALIVAATMLAIGLGA